MSKKILMIVTPILIVLLLFSFVTPIFAVAPSEIEPHIKTDGKTVDGVKDAAGGIIGIIQVVGTAVAIFMLIYIGIKYVVASPNDKADIKHTAVIYVIAAIFIFAASNILGIISDWADGIFGGSST